MFYSRTVHKRPCGSCALHAAYLKLHTLRICYTYCFFHCKNGLHERASMLRDTWIACSVSCTVFLSSMILCNIPRAITIIVNSAKCIQNNTYHSNNSLLNLIHKITVQSGTVPCQFFVRYPKARTWLGF